MGCCQNVPLEGDVSSLIEVKRKIYLAERNSPRINDQVIRNNGMINALKLDNLHEKAVEAEYNPENSKKSDHSSPRINILNFPQQQVIPVNSDRILKPVTLFGGIVKKAVAQVKEQGEALEIDKHLMQGVNVAGKFVNDQADVVGGAIKEGYEQSASLIQAQISIIKDGLDDAIKAVKDLKIQKRLTEMVYPVLRKVFVHSVTCEIESKYEIKEILGKGSCSTVKRVIDKATGYERAAKIMVKGSLSESQTKNLISEIETLKVLDHQNIVRVYEIIEEVSKLCIITELCSGGELFDRIVESEGFDEIKASEIMFQLLSGVIHIHKNGFIHRDLKPENLLFLDRGSNTIKIIDFGIAKEGQLIMKKKNSCVGSVFNT